MKQNLRRINVTKLVTCGKVFTMRSVKIGELKAKLSAHISYAKNGEEVLIFDRETPVARLVPLGPLGDYDEQTRRLMEKGILAPPRRPRIPGERWHAPPGRKISNEVMSHVWREERGD